MISLAVIIMAGLLWFSCERNESHLGPLSISCTSDLECKVNDPLKTSDPVPENSCIKFNYLGDSLLRMVHYNAGFNCCPEGFLMDIEVKGDSLIIREAEKKMGCKCNCLYNLEIEVRNLPADTYHVRFVEPYVDYSMPQLRFDLDLKNNPTGQYCVTRPEGWWR